MENRNKVKVSGKQLNLSFSAFILLRHFIIRNIKIVFLLHIILNGYKPANAQSEFVEESILKELNGDINSTGNISLTDQFGEYNTVISTRINGNQYLPNKAREVQYGNYNEANIHQIGSGNESNLVQLGNGNDYELVMKGNENRSAVLQDGDENKISQYLMGNDMDYTIVQEGTDNTLIQVEKNTEIPKYEVRQEGNGIMTIMGNGY